MPDDDHEAFIHDDTPEGEQANMAVVCIPLKFETTDDVEIQAKNTEVLDAIEPIEGIELVSNPHAVLEVLAHCYNSVAAHIRQEAAKQARDQ